MRATVSRFYRDPEVWQAVGQEVLPVLLERSPEQVLSAWSAGCASGEEAYTLAMVWQKLPAALRRGRRLEILATDIDEEVLARGRTGIFAGGALRNLPRGWREAFFVARGDSWQVADSLRELVSFEKADLLEDAPPPSARLVFCRYLAFTYYRGDRLERALAPLLAALSPGGALVIGQKEFLPALARQVLEPWPGTPAIYRRPLPGRRSPGEAPK